MNIKVNNQKEKTLIPKFMREGYDEVDGQYFDYKGLGFYLIKSETGNWCITEKTTNKFMVTWRKTRKQVFVEFEEFMSNHYEKVKEHIMKDVQ
ncbi:hypothetical protein [Bacillus subtilis]|uniref:hypothetical protein n=1 Tax=Bacillus subtilis TaxID=1423 RepID=UPI001268935C|nr:hypothetical protein [Bacillus subtilis]